MHPAIVAQSWASVGPLVMVALVILIGAGYVALFPAREKRRQEQEK